MFAAKEIDGDSLEREEILEGGEIEMRTDVKIFVSSDGLEEEDFFAFTDETRSPVRGKVVKGGRKMEEVAEMRFQSDVVLKQLTAVVSRCAVSVR